MIEVRDFFIEFPNHDAMAFRPLNFSISKGDCILLTGSTGSGKSTLVKALVGLIPHYISANLHGDITLDSTSLIELRPSQRSQSIGYVPQNPFQSFVTDSVEDEIAFTLESHAISSDEMAERIEELLSLFSLTNLRTCAPRTLSTGEAQRLAIAAAIALDPQYLILDEPISALDKTSADFVIAFLHSYSKNHAVLIAEHRRDLLKTIATCEVNLDSVEAMNPATNMPSHISLIIGDNGSGKTTYLEGYISKAERKVGYVPQNPAELFLTQSVRDECALTPGSLQKLKHLAPSISELAHPRDLSEGEKLLLALSIAAVLGSDEIVLDEPTRGLDPMMKEKVIEFISHLEVPVLIATHDRDLISATTGTIRHIEELL